MIKETQRHVQTSSSGKAIPSQLFLPIWSELWMWLKGKRIKPQEELSNKKVDQKQKCHQRLRLPGQTRFGIPLMSSGIPDKLILQYALRLQKLFNSLSRYSRVFFFCINYSQPIIEQLQLQSFFSHSEPFKALF